MGLWKAELWRLAVFTNFTIGNRSLDINSWANKDGINVVLVCGG